MGSRDVEPPFAFVPQPGNDQVDVSVDLRAPDVPGPFRVYFRLVQVEAPHTAVGDRLWVDFECV